MKKLILHIGLPKTGTTTLQESLFPGLHNLSIINYLGTTLSQNQYNTYFKNFSNDFLNFLWYNKPSLNSLEDYIISEKINIFSSESLSGLNYFNIKKKSTK